MNECNRNSHAVHDIKYHIIWVTKYRYYVLNGNIAVRTRELIRQGCTPRGVNILQRRSSRLLKEQFLDLQKRYWD